MLRGEACSAKCLDVEIAVEGGGVGVVVGGEVRLRGATADTVIRGGPIGGGPTSLIWWFVRWEWT